MIITFRITNFLRDKFDVVARKVFDEHGGTIGRGPQNTWVLPDPYQYISNRHATVELDDGEFYLMDTSTNGTWVNGEMLEKGNRIVLIDGDAIQIGDYEIAVRLRATKQPAPARENAPKPDGSRDSLGLFVRRPPRQSPAGASSPDTPAPTPNDGSLPIPREEPSPRPRAESLQAAHDDLSPAPHQELWREEEPLPLGPAASTSPESRKIPEGWDELELSRSPAAPVVASRHGAQTLSEDSVELGLGTRRFRVLPTGTGGEGDDAKKLRSFLLAAGLDPAHADEEFMAELGEIFATVVQGMIELLRARSEIKNQFRLEMTTLEPTENNPLKFSIDAKDALHNLFMKEGRGFQAPRDAFDEGFQDLKAHQMATIAGMRAAFEAMLAQLEPGALEKTFEKGQRRTRVPAVMNKSRYWDLYGDLFKDIRGEPDAGFQRLFGQAFGRAYERQMLILAKRPKP